VIRVGVRVRVRVGVRVREGMFLGGEDFQQRHL